jgi:hypothetical protein
VETETASFRFPKFWRRPNLRERWMGVKNLSNDNANRLRWMMRASQQKTMAERLAEALGILNFKGFPAQKEDPLRDSENFAFS